MGYILIRGKKREIKNMEPTSILIPEYNIIIKDTVFGEGVVIWSNVNIYGAEIGSKSKIGAFVEIRKGVKIGNKVKIEPLAFLPEGVIVEDCVFVGPNVVFTNDIKPASCDEKGRIIEEYKIVPTLVREGAAIGASSVIVCGVTIGRHAMIGAGSVIVEDVPDNAVVYGEKAKIRSYR